MREYRQRYERNNETEYKSNHKIRVDNWINWIRIKPKPKAHIKQNGWHMKTRKWEENKPTR